METRVLTLFDDEFFPQEPPKEKAKKEKTSKAAAPVAPEEPVSEPEHSAEEIEVQPDIPVAEEIPSGPPSVNTEPLQENEITPATPIPAGLHKEWPAAPAASAQEISIGKGAQEPDDNDSAPEEKTGLSQEDAVPEENTGPDTTTSRQTAITEETIEATEAEAVPEYNGERSADEAGIDEMPDMTAEAPIAAVPEHAAPTEEEEVTEEQVAENTAPETESAAEPGTENDGGADRELNQQILSELIQLDYTALMQKDYSFDIRAATVISKEATAKASTPDMSEEAEQEETEAEIDEVFEEVAPLPEWKLDKKYYTIGEVAQLFEVNTSHIRFWTNEFKLKPRTTRKGDRLYSPKDIAELRLIHHLVKVKKHTIKGAREKLKSEKSGVNNKLDLKESLLQLKDTLLKIRDQL